MMQKITDHPPLCRVIAAFALAPTIAGVAFAVFILVVRPALGGPSPTLQDVGMVVVLTAIGGYPPAFILGIPAYFILRAFVRLTPLHYVGVGMIIAALPWIALSPWARINSENVIAVAAISGGLGGAVFWLVLTVGRRRAT